MNMIVTTSKKLAAATTLLLIILCSTAPAWAQSDYERLAMRANQPQIHFTVFTLPGQQKGKITLTTTFQFSNNSLAFKKVNNKNTDKQFFSDAGLNLEVFKSPEKIREKRGDERWRFEQIDVEGLQSVGRDTWRDTAYAATYEETKSKTEGLNGSMQVQVDPGFYTYLVQRAQQEKEENNSPRGRFNRGVNSRTRNIYVPNYDETSRNSVILVKDVDNAIHPSRLTLLNMGDNVTYGKDFYAFIHLPKYDASKSYSLQVNRIEMRDRDTTMVNQVWDSSLSQEQIIQNVRPELKSSRKGIGLSLQSEPDSYTYALIKIPNSQFPNAVYNLTVHAGGTNRPVTQSIFRSYWSDIPTSLLSLDVSIDMLHFITDKETVKQIDKGSDREREQKFREFWAKKDPTPDTEFNELEAEFYRRIDYAYDHFSSQDTPGYESDQGRIYINYGPPNDIKRTFPTDGPTTEVWTYPNRTFVFKATSGFGDFKLVPQQ